MYIKCTVQCTLRGEKMKLTEFAKARNIDNQRVSRYINRHKDIFKCTVHKEGKEIILDDEAVEILNEKYPLPTQIIVEDNELAKKNLQLTEELKEAYKYISQMEHQLGENVALIEAAKYKTLLLEDKEKQVENMENELKDKDREIEAYGNLVEELKEKLQTEKDKTWWQKLRGK